MRGKSKQQNLSNEQTDNILNNLSNKQCCKMIDDIEIIVISELKKKFVIEIDKLSARIHVYNCVMQMNIELCLYEQYKQ